jgi:hypothetical protein
MGLGMLKVTFFKSKLKYFWKMKKVKVDFVKLFKTLNVNIQGPYKSALFIHKIFMLDTLCNASAI